MLSELPESPETLARATDVRLALATTLTQTRGAGSPEAEASYLCARELADRLGEPTRLYQALWGLWYVNLGRGRYPSARELGEPEGSLRGTAQAMIDNGGNPTDEMERELDELLSKVQVNPAYQRALVAQSNFDKLMMQVNNWIAEGIKSGAASPIITLS